jgi:lycopene cyclase CruA
VQQLLYLEIPTPDTEAVRDWLHYRFELVGGDKVVTPNGFVVKSGSDPQSSTQSETNRELCVFVWSLQRTTYLKAFRWSKAPVENEQRTLEQLTAQIRAEFPNQYPEPPVITSAMAGKSIFDILAAQYPITVKYFRKFPNGEYDLNRVYWWEQRWRESIKNPQQPRQVVVKAQEDGASQSNSYDIIYIGGALGVIHAAMMAKLGYRVCLIERLHFGRMNREWNISRSELEVLVQCGLLTQAEMESVIQCEYIDGFNKFFDGNNPPQAIAPVLHTPTVLNLALDTSKLLKLCGDKLRLAGGEIIDQTDFEQAEIGNNSVTVLARQQDRQIKITGY